MSVKITHAIKTPDTASDIINVPAGGIAATNVQTALNELDTETVKLTGDQTVAGVKTFSSNPVLSGGAISFPSTQVASGGANSLDDYEEGTWTPAFVASGSTFNYSSQGGTYTKIGRLVCGQFAIVLAATGNTLTANALTISGLPFTINANPVIFPAKFGNMATSIISFDVRGTNASATLTCEKITAAAASVSPMLANDLHATSGTTIYCGFMYNV